MILTRSVTRFVGWNIVLKIPTPVEPYGGMGYVSVFRDSIYVIIHCPFGGRSWIGRLELLFEVTFVSHMVDGEFMVGVAWQVK